MALDVPILGDTKYQRRKGYITEINANMSQIRDRTKNRPNWSRINRRISSEFTYQNLKQMLLDIMKREVASFKINLGFGCMLYHAVHKTFRYFYVSNNLFLFDKAFTISHIYQLFLTPRYFYQAAFQHFSIPGKTYFSQESINRTYRSISTRINL